MKLAILGTRGIPARYGGFETFAEEVSVRLAQQGVVVTVFCEKREGPLPAEYRGVKLRHIPAPRLGPLTTVLFDLRCLWHARKAYRVVYMLGYGSSVFCFLPRLWGCTVWINMDGLEWTRAKWGRFAKLYLRLMEWLALRVSDRVIADADAIRRHLYGRHRSDTPCSVIPYGAPIIERPPDGAALEGWGLRPGGYYLIVCRLEPENHVREIVEGYVLSEDTAPLVVIGDYKSGTGYAGGLLEATDPRVRFLGAVYEEQKLQALRYYCKAYFHGHSVGGTNPSLLEALGCGNIVVAHDNDFNREVAGDAAFYFQKPAEIAGHVEAIRAMSDQERGRRRERSQRRIHDAYTWESITRRYEKILYEDARRQR